MTLNIVHHYHWLLEDRQGHGLMEGSNHGQDYVRPLCLGCKNIGGYTLGYRPLSNNLRLSTHLSHLCKNFIVSTSHQPKRHSNTHHSIETISFRLSSTVPMRCTTILTTWRTLPASLHAHIAVACRDWIGRDEALEIPIGNIIISLSGYCLEL
jgi:hypothetical protein